MRKEIGFMLLALMLCMPVAFADAERVSGSADLAWTNYPDRPQQFSGSISGDLVGDITLTSNTHYDDTAAEVGVTDASIAADFDGLGECEGFYFGSNVNAGRNAGTFTLSCSDDVIIQGGMNGVNDNSGNIAMDYDAFKITQIAGPQGERGDSGMDGQDGAPGDDGKDGIDGQDGQDGTDGQDGAQGIPGEKGDKGDQGVPGEKGDTGERGLPGLDGADGAQGIPGEQGPKGDKGDTGAQGPKGDKGDPGESADESRLTYLESVIDGMKQWQPFAQFWIWFDSAKECMPADTKCGGSARYTCSDYGWSFDQICTYGCTSGTCNPAPKENCATKATEYSCSGYKSVAKDWYSCQSGHGTSTSCDPGYCKAWTLSSTCYHGCDAVTGKCKV
jgi:hypothetical protein